MDSTLSQKEFHRLMERIDVIQHELRLLNSKIDALMNVLTAPVMQPPPPKNGFDQA